MLSKPGRLAAHVTSEVKEKIWKGNFVDIFSLIRAKRREIEDKENKAQRRKSHGWRRVSLIGYLVSMYT